MCLLSDVEMKRKIVITHMAFAGEMALRQESATALVSPLLPESYREGARPPLATEVFEDVRKLFILFYFIIIVQYLCI